jgi:hypothetical protein
VKLIVKYADGPPVGSKPNRRLLGTLDFVQSAVAPLSASTIQRTIVPVDDENALILEASYTSVNKVLSIIAGYRSINDETYAFSTTTEFESVPTYFCFRLPTGYYVELAIDNR